MASAGVTSTPQTRCSAKSSEVLGLLLRALAAVADHHPETGVPGRALGAAGDVDEERVAHVQHQQGHDAAAARPELPGRLAADVAELLDRREDTGPGVGKHRLGAVDHVGDRAHGDSGLPGHVLDPCHTRHLPCPTDASGHRASAPVPVHGRTYGVVRRAVVRGPRPPIELFQSARDANRIHRIPSRSGRRDPNIPSGTAHQGTRAPAACHESIHALSTDERPVRSRASSGWPRCR